MTEPIPRPTAPRRRPQRWGPALLFLSVVVTTHGPAALARGESLKGPIWMAQASPVSDPPEVKEWRRQVDQLVEQGNVQEAIPWQEKELAWTENTYGPDHPDTAISLNHLAGLYEAIGAYVKAESFYLRALRIQEQALGSDHAAMATTLNNLAVLYDNQGNYKKAEAFYLRALAIREKTLPPDQTGLANSLNNLGTLYVSQGDYGRAKTSFLRALALIEKVFGPDDPITATALNNLGFVQKKLGAYGEAESFYLRVLAIRERKQGLDHPDTATVLNNLASLYDEEGAYGKAERLYLRALAIREKRLPPNHPDTAINLSNLAALYADLADYGKAEPLYRRALAINETTLGTEHPATAITLNNLALLSANQGAYGQAEALYQRALAIREKVLGPLHPDTATSRNNLAVLYVNQGDYANAEALSQRSLAILEQALGPDHPALAVNLNTLAVLAVNQKRYAKAEPLFLRALAMREATFGPSHPALAITLNNLANLYDEQNSDAKAERLYLRALAILEKALGPDHPSTATTRNNLALLLMKQAAFDKGEPLLRRGIASQSRFLQEQLPLLPQAARASQVQALHSAWETAFTGADRSPRSAELALFSRLNRYGLQLEIEQRQALLSRAPGPTRALAEQLSALTAQLADVRLAPALRQALRSQKDGLEKALYRLLPALEPTLVDPARVARALPDGAALVEFQRFRPFDGRQPPDQRWGAPRYLALVLTPDGITRAVDLGPADAIDLLIARALEATRAGGDDPTALWRPVSRAVFPAPVSRVLASASQWILAPDGELSRIPYAALPSPTDPNRFLGDSVSLRLITSGRSLVRPASGPEAKPSRPLVLADPDYGPAPAGAMAWRRLPESAREGREVAGLIHGTLYEKAEATTRRLTSARGPKVAHVATHGVFAMASEPSTRKTPPPLAENGQLRSAFAGFPPDRDDAMLNSAIVLAGANRHRRPAAPDETAPLAPNGADDGYLTAKEAATLQLAGTELVVLSACDTASGAQQSGEGLYGLQRALNVAGARSTLLSLWKVDDAATAYFMQRYYTLLKQGKGRMEALLAVQNAFRTQPLVPAWEYMRYWAAWQLLGDTGPIQGL